MRSSRGSASIRFTQAMATVTGVAVLTLGTLERAGLPLWSAIVSAAAFALVVACEFAFRARRRSDSTSGLGDEDQVSVPALGQAKPPLDLTPYLNPNPIRRPQCAGCGSHHIHTSGLIHRCARCAADWPSEHTPYRTTTRPKVNQTNV